jgi:hypothetical protein
MLCRVLDVVVYESAGGPWHAQEVPDPTWEQVEEAVRRLDRHLYPFVILRLDEEVVNDQQLEIMGGRGAYWVAGTIGDYYQRRLHDPNRGQERVRVWTSDQGFAESAMYLCSDVEVVLRAARYFCEHGDLDPGLPWEEDGD